MPRSALLVAAFAGLVVIAPLAQQSSLDRPPADDIGRSGPTR
jgi:hypothetical protein